METETRRSPAILIVTAFKAIYLVWSITYAFLVTSLITCVYAAILWSAFKTTNILEFKWLILPENKRVPHLVKTDPNTSRVKTCYRLNFLFCEESCDVMCA